MEPANPRNHWKRNAAACVTLALAGGFGSLLWQDARHVKTEGAAAFVAPLGRTHAEPCKARVVALAPVDPEDETVVLRPKGDVAGVPLPPLAMNPDSDKGRVLKLDPVAVRSWAGLQAGSKIVLPGVDGEPLDGVVNLAMEDNGWLRIGGDLTTKRGTFTVNTDFNEVAGNILLPGEKVGYEITMDGLDVVLVERRLSSLVCMELPAKDQNGALPAGGAGATTAGATPATTSSAATPVLNSRPGSKGVIFLVFDGETVTDPYWCGGKTIVAARAALSASQITEIVKYVAEDFAPFDVTVTTDRTVYEAAAPGCRMKTIITPTTTAAPGYGGYAYIGSWRNAGKGFKSDTPCWVFNISQKASAETISHEVGHTLGLTHDGQLGGSAYYSGHGGGTGVPTSWAPIMGTGFSVSLSQWSKGDYVKANNTQDDLAIIVGQNNFGYATDLTNAALARPLPFTAAQTFEGKGMLQRSINQDVYELTTSGGTFSVSVRASGAYTNVDPQLELTDANGGSIAISDLPDSLTAALSVSLKAGVYRLGVRSAATGPKPAGGYVTGYPEYGSLGGYIISGSLVGALKVPMIIAPRDFSAVVGRDFSAKIGVSNGAELAFVSGTLPEGITFDPQKGLLEGTPVFDTVGNPPVPFVLSATNAEGTVTKECTFQVGKNAMPLTDAFSNASVAATTPQAPWVGVLKTAASGSMRVVAESGYVPNGASTMVQLRPTVVPEASRAASWVLMTFWWKTSTEAGHDVAKCLVNGIQAKDFVTGKALILSGESDWVRQTVRLDGTSPLVEFNYAKDASLAAGRDRIWVYVDSVGQPPVIQGQPPAVTASPASTTTASASFSLTARVDGAQSVQWVKDGITLKEGVTATGSVLSGATRGTLVVSKVGGADAGNYWLEARNTDGTTLSTKAVVSIASKPVITQSIVAPVGLKVGDPLTVSVAASGTGPLFYQWKKNGALLRTTATPSHLVSQKVAATDAGKYSVTVTNSFGVATSPDVPITVNPAQ